MIVGSGPAGATTARFASESGLKVLLVDKKQELGAPIQCSGAVSGPGLAAAGVEPEDEFVLKSIYGFEIFNAEGESNRIDYRELKPDKYPGEALGYVVDRRRFDRRLMTLAERVGTEVWLKTNAIGYKPLEDGTCEVYLNRFNQDITVKAKVVVGADGLQSQVGKWANLRTHIKLSELASCLQVIVDKVEADGLLEIVTGEEWAPGGYAWVFPKDHGYAEIGLGVIKSITDLDARYYLDRFMKESFFKDRFKNARVLEIQGGGVPLASPLKKQFAENLILVGDAARHVNPITGGGIHTALSAGRIAGKYLANLIKEGKRPTADNLEGYQDKWYEDQGEKMWKLYNVKTDIFKMKQPEQDKALFDTMSYYFSPDSEYRKI